MEKEWLSSIEEELQELKTRPISTFILIMPLVAPLIPIYYFGLRVIDIIYLIGIIIAYSLFWNSRGKQFKLDNLCYGKCLLLSTLSYLLNDNDRKAYTLLTGDLYVKLQIMKGSNDQVEQIITWNIKGRQKLNKHIHELNMIISGSAYMNMNKLPLTAYDVINKRTLAVKFNKERALNKQITICLENEGIKRNDDYNINIQLRIVESNILEKEWQIYIFDPRNISKKIDHLYFEIESNYAPLDMALIELFRVDRNNLKRNMVCREKLEYNQETNFFNVKLNKVTGKTYFYLLIISPVTLYSEE